MDLVRKGTIQKNIKERRINIPVIAASLLAVIAQFPPIWKAEMLGYSELRAIKPYLKMTVQELSADYHQHQPKI